MQEITAIVKWMWGRRCLGAVNVGYMCLVQGITVVKWRWHRCLDAVPFVYLCRRKLLSNKALMNINISVYSQKLQFGQGYCTWEDYITIVTMTWQVKVGYEQWCSRCGNVRMQWIKKLIKLLWRGWSLLWQCCAINRAVTVTLSFTCRAGLHHTYWLRPAQNWPENEVKFWLTVHNYLLIVICPHKKYILRPSERQREGGKIELL